jgi:acyl carrier protein
MQNLSILEQEIKSLIISSLGLEDVSIEDISSEAPLFGEGLGLDSIDALELGIALSKKYGITLDPNAEDIRENFSSVKSLAEYVANNEAAGSDAEE